MSAVAIGRRTTEGGASSPERLAASSEPRTTPVLAIANGFGVLVRGHVAILCGLVALACGPGGGDSAERQAQAPPPQAGEASPAPSAGAGARPSSAGDWDWKAYASTPESTKYAPLDQIDAGNFSQLEVAWTWTPPDVAWRRNFLARKAIQLISPPAWPVTARGRDGRSAWGHRSEKVR